MAELRPGSGRPGPQGDQTVEGEDAGDGLRQVGCQPRARGSAGLVFLGNDHKSGQTEATAPGNAGDRRSLPALSVSKEPVEEESRLSHRTIDGNVFILFGDVVEFK